MQHVQKLRSNVPAADVVPECALKVIACVEVNRVQVFLCIEHLLDFRNHSRVATNARFGFRVTRTWFSVNFLKSEVEGTWVIYSYLDWWLIGAYLACISFKCKIVTGNQSSCICECANPVRTAKVHKKNFPKPIISQPLNSINHTPRAANKWMICS